MSLPTDRLEARQKAVAMIAFGYRRHVVVEPSDVTSPWGTVGNPIDPRFPPTCPYNCREDCRTCGPQYLPVSRDLSDHAAKELAQRLVDQIMANRASR
jgi:hypothetical protein